MTMRRRTPMTLATVVSVLLVVVACATTQPSPPSRTDFQDKVLTALAARNADEHINQVRDRAQRAFAQRERERKGENASADSFLDLMGVIAGVSGYPWVSSGAKTIKERIAVNRQAASQREEAELKEYVAWLDTRRDPFKAKLLDQYVGLVKETTEGGGIFSLCVNGKERRYSAATGDYTRLDDGAGPCPDTKISLDD